MEEDELHKILEQARELAKKYKVSLEEALLLIAVHEVACVHFHVDQVIAAKRK